jgi:hypothetical protein
LYENDAAGLAHVCKQTAQFRSAEHAPGKEFSCKMTENMQADCVPSRQAGFNQWFLKKEPNLPLNQPHQKRSPADSVFADLPYSVTGCISQ